MVGKQIFMYNHFQNGKILANGNQLIVLDERSVLTICYLEAAGNQTLENVQHPLLPNPKQRRFM